MKLRPASFLLALALALSLPVFAAAPAATAEMEDEDLPDPVMPAVPASPPAGVRKITDAALTCGQIHAESLALDAAIAKHRADAEAAQREANVAQEEVMQQAHSGMGAPVGSTLLGMVPGGGMVSSLAAQAQASAQRSAMQKGAGRMTAAYQRMAQAQEQLAYAQARNDHIVGLFLQKKCKLPDAGAAPGG
ncbi:hypothetical protein [Ramlibacter humi]|uniref:Uncharacterized protein n=1 Tax=Ramlibacter humi TaxID=2530451 RepID=A0A4Z0BLT1_9BURK|nr:hypothetical protein [Ramlibacter humi]TFZ00286.1 hypothetical protein EZ216_14395 [Ramlibacter humi]